MTFFIKYLTVILENWLKSIQFLIYSGKIFKLLAAWSWQMHVWYYWDFKLHSCTSPKSSIVLKLPQSEVTYTSHSREKIALWTDFSSYHSISFFLENNVTMQLRFMISSLFTSLPTTKHAHAVWILWRRLTMWCGKLWYTTQLWYNLERLGPDLTAREYWMGENSLISLRLQECNSKRLRLASHFLPIWGGGQCGSLIVLLKIHVLNF